MQQSRLVHAKNLRVILFFLLPLVVQGKEINANKGWLTSWSWPAVAASKAVERVSDEQLVDMVYSRKNRAATKRADHPTLEERLYYSSEYDDGGYSTDVSSDDYGAGTGSLYADDASSVDAYGDDYGVPDYGDYVVRRRQGEQPSSFMTAAISPGQDQPLVTQYSHSIVHH